MSASEGSSSQPPPPRPLTSLPPPPAGAVPVAPGGPTPFGLGVASVAALFGWVIVGFVLFNVYVFTGRELSCTANRGDAYRSCVRQEDVTELVAEALAMGLSVVGLVIVIRSIRRPDVHGGRQAFSVGALAAVLGLVCVGVWIDGSQGGWAPSRPFPYDPLPTVWGHVAMTIGVVIGSLVGAIVPLSRRQRSTNPSEPPATPDN